MTMRHTVAILIFDGVDLLDTTGPAEVFALLDREMDGASPYDVVLAAPSMEPVRTSSGVRILPDRTIDELATTHIGTLIVPGAAAAGEGGRIRAIADPHIVEAVRALERHSSRIASVCVGAHILADAGLLDGKRATTHWSTAQQLAEEHPQIEVDADPIYIKQGRIWTAAGISSCLDLSLALVAEDLGDTLALAVARQLVVYLKRPGGQSQFSVPLLDDPVSRGLDALRLYMANNLSGDLRVQTLAERSMLSERHFARVFRAEFGQTPAHYVEALRVEAARRLLETTDALLSTVASETGLGSIDTLTRAFHRRLRTTPRAYRQRFRSTSDS